MTAYERTKTRLLSEPGKWLVTGAAGFIGSHLVEALLRLDQNVVGLDNFDTGRQQNLEDVRGNVSPGQWARLAFLEGDIQSLEVCQQACRGIEFVLHQAGLGSVPRSLQDPIRSHATNVSGFLNMLVAARDQHVKRFVYASSSSVYGDDPNLPKLEDQVGRPLSPYAATKSVNEIYAGVFARSYGLQAIGLRYFNVFGRRQALDGPYAAVIPKWVATLLVNEPVFINGDGETSRDFCYVANVVQANVLAATTDNPEAVNRVFNVAARQRTTLNDLFSLMRDQLALKRPTLKCAQPVYRNFRPGDVRHSLADIQRAQTLLGYEPSHTVTQGLAEALEWYEAECGKDRARRLGKQK